MAGERLPVNILPGILPGSYSFCDQCNDNSKWDNFQGNGLFDGSFQAFSGINIGDAYGYYGQGLNISVDESIGIATDNVCLMERPVLLPLSANTFEFGAIFRPNISCYLASNAGLPAVRYLDFIMLMNIYDITGASATKNIGFRCRTSAGNDGGTRISCRQRFEAIVMTDAAYPLTFTPTLLENVLNGGFFQSAAAPALGWPASVPWMRVSMTVENGTLKLVKVNRTVYPVSINLGTTAVGLNQYQNSIIIGARTNTDAAGTLVTVGWDLDQIWISDTENRV